MKNWRLWGGILVSLLSLYLAVKGMDFRGLLAALSHTHWIWLVPTFVILTGGMWARALRWRLLLPGEQGTRPRRLFNLVNISYLVNNISPFRLGDVLRAYLYAELERLSIVRVLSTVVVERVADTLTIVFLLLLLLPLMSMPAYIVRPAFAVGLAAAGVACLLLFLALRREWSLKAFDRLTEVLGLPSQTWLHRLLATAVDGVAALGSWRRAAGVLAWSFVIWLGTAVQFFLVMQAARLRLPFTAALAALCLTSLGMVMPSSPGYIGVFEYITVLALSLFAVGREEALGYALVLHGLSYASFAILGAASLWSEGYSQGRLRAVLARAEDGELGTQDAR